MRKLIVIAAVLAIVGAFLGGTSLYLAHQEQFKQENLDYHQAKDLLAQSKPQAALLIARPYLDRLSATKPDGVDWLPIVVDALATEKDVIALTALYERFPRAVSDNEEAALLVAAALLSQKNISEYIALRNNWSGKANKEAAWLVLNADLLLLQDRRNEAKALLQSKTFSGPEDTDRLVRLALLASTENLSTAWNLLSEALVKDPKNSVITTYRAQILEAINKPALARVEYLSAIHKDPNNPLLILQLGEFYRRHHHYDLAIETWSQGLHLANSNPLWLKTLFWTRMTVPLKEFPKEQPPTTGTLAPLIAFLDTLPPGQFWDEATFRHVPNGEAFLRQCQETFWLRLASSLLRGQEAKATELLDFNTFHATNWAPQLQSTLQQILAYRRYGILHIDKIAPSNTPEGTAPTINSDASHQFFTQMADLARHSPPGLPAENIPDEIRSLLTSDYAFPAAFLAGGWFEAALTFPMPERVPDTFPDWVAFAYTQALRHTQGPESALRFAVKQKSTPSLTLLTGELFLAVGSDREGIAILKKVSHQQNVIGLKAALLISQAQLERKDYGAATDTILTHPPLADNVLGKETLARIALKQGDIQRADALYSSIENESLEAKLYLARRAYTHKQWDRALKLTEQLVVEFPDNIDLQQDLQKLREKIQHKE